MLVSVHKKTIPDVLVLATIAKVTLPEPDRIAAARRWLGQSNHFGDREIHILNGFWEVLDDAPHPPEVNKVVPRHARYT